MATAIEEILANLEVTDVAEQTAELFYLVDELGENYELYNDAQVRIAGLYYRTKSVDTESLYQLSRYTEASPNCEIRTLIEQLHVESEGVRAAKLMINQMDTILYDVACEETEDGEDPDDYNYFPFLKEQHLKFECEPTNRHDPNAIKILYKGKHCGYVPKDDALLLTQIYNTERIEGAIGIVRKVVGDARVTFDLFLPKVKPKKRIVDDMLEAMEAMQPAVKEDTRPPYVGEWRTMDYWNEEWDGTKWTPVKNSSRYIPTNEGGCGHMEQWNGSEWAPYPGTSRFNTKTSKLESFIDGAWGPYVSLEEQEKRKAQQGMIIGCQPVASTETTVASTAYVQSLLSPSPAIVSTYKKSKYSELDYRDYTGYLRTLTEYATFAHVE